MRFLLQLLSSVIPALILYCSNPASQDSTESISPAGMVMINAKGNSFTIGSETDLDPNNDPIHTVSFTYDYLISETEITQKEYAGIMSVNPSTIHGDSLPVYNLTWYDAILFCNKKSVYRKLDTVYTYDSISGIPGQGAIVFGCKADYSKKGYRLPSEAEWEFAARAGTATEVFWGSENDIATDSFAWHAGNSGLSVQPVARLKPNAWGLYDMIGNASEWCTDWFEKYSAAVTIDPFGPDSGATKVLRNGDAMSDRNYLRVAYRNNFGPSRIGAQVMGFRTVLKN